MSAVYVLSYATEVTPSLKSQKHIGHIVAPKAYIHDMNGDVNGCFIAKSLNLTGSESHMFPYHGQKIKNNNTTPEPTGDNTQYGNETQEKTIQEQGLYQQILNQVMIQTIHQKIMKLF